MGFEKQLWRIQNPLAHRRRRIAPGGIEFSGLTAREAVFGKCLSHAPTVGKIGARHRRQIFHRHMRGDLAGANPLLHRFGKLLDQRQPSRDPTRAAIKSPRQILQAVAEPLLQLGKQPALLERVFLLRQPHRPVQHQRVGFAHVPDESLYRVAPQFLQRRNALVAIDDLVAIRLIFNSDNHDRRLLSAGRKRRQQPLLPPAIARAQMLIPAVELMKFQLHFLSLRPGCTLLQVGSGLARLQGEVCPQAL